MQISAAFRQKNEAGLDVSALTYENVNMTISVSERCLRCGTKLRNKRTSCPSCGWDLVMPETENTGPVTAHESGPVIKKVAAKANVKICPICLSTVPDDQIVEQDGQKICQTCSENLKQKAAKKAAAPPPEARK